MHIFQVLCLEDILVKQPSVSLYIPRRWQSSWSKKTQVFPFLTDKANSYTKSIKPATKICFRPYEGSGSVLHSVDSNFSAFSTMTGHRRFPLYLYDEGKRARGQTLGVMIPGRIIQLI